MIPLAIAAAAILAGSRPGAADSCASAPRSAAGARLTEQRWVDALERHDLRALDCIIDDSFIDTNWRGERIDKREMLAGVAKRPPPTLRLSDVDVVLLGEVAIVRGVNAERNSDPNLTGSVRFTDVFAYRGRAWRAISGQESVIQGRPLRSAAEH
jgi:hypothetical protein